jgi:clan AA aspartic protease
MMTGFFTPDGEPAFPVHVTGPAGNLDVDAVIDTGFNGELTLPREQLDTLGVPKATVTEVTLADGRVRDVPLYEANVLLSGATREVFVAEVPTMPLVGTGLLQGFSLPSNSRPKGRSRSIRSAPFCKPPTGDVRPSSSTSLGIDRGLIIRIASTRLQYKPPVSAAQRQNEGMYPRRDVNPYVPYGISNPSRGGQGLPQLNHAFTEKRGRPIEQMLKKNRNQ